MSSSRLICLTIITILILGCATTSENSYTAACNPRSFCFNQRNIRNVETIDRDTLLVRVGSSNCPYLIHLDGIFFSSRLTDEKAFGFEKEIVEFWKNERKR